MAFTPAKVQAMIAKSGLPAIWRTIRTGYAPDAAEPKQNAETDYPCFAVKLPTENAGQETRYTASDGQPAGNSTFYVSPPVGAPTPSMKDLLVVAGKRYRLKSLDLLQPAGTLLLITATVYE